MISFLFPDRCTLSGQQTFIYLAAALKHHRVRTDLTSFNGIRMEFRYEIYLADKDTLIAEGRTSHCFIDEETRIPLTIKKRLPDAFEQMRNELS